MTPPQFRIGELARRVGTTPRAVRYYEELGLLPGSDRSDGAHRVYDEQDEVR
ncbi:MAG TPA: MerR family DNA-binding transcriptional regulator, partial [Gaiellales bacterium]|nr:MerR family DNA-binding transcriptional regulator [Gaiellales bacterium]